MQRSSSPPPELTAGSLSPSSPWSGRRRVITVSLSVTLILLQTVPSAVIGGGVTALSGPLLTNVATTLIVFVTMSLVRRGAPDGGPDARRFVSGAVMSLLLCAVAGVTLWSLRGPLPFGRLEHVSLLGFAGMSVVVGVFTLGTWALAVEAPAIWEAQRVRELEVNNLRLERAELKVQAELSRLRGQLEPHFLLNTLNVLSGLVGVDVPRARRILECLGDLLRDALTDHDEAHSIADEVGWLRRYVEILEIRHGDALRVVWDVDPSTLSHLIPRLVLQPILENAVHHGALQRRGGEVHLSIKPLDGGRLRCTVEDNGPGLRDEASGTGIGLKNARRRLELSDPASTVSLASSPAGTTATLTWHTAAIKVTP